MPADEFDPWATTSGLPDDIDVTITDAYFGFNPEYNDGQTCVITFEGTTDDDDAPEFSAFYACGKGWEPADKGARAVREDGKRKGFNNTSAYGLFFTAALNSGAGEVLKERGTPQDAEVWKGLKFHMNRIAHDYKGDIGKIERLLPTAFLGEASKPSGRPAKAAAKATAGTGRKGAPQKATPPPADEGYDVDEALWNSLVALAKEHDSHDAFVEAVYTADIAGDVEGNEQAEAAVMDVVNGPWAEAQTED